MNSPNIASRVWSRTLALGRDSVTISSAFAREIRQNPRLEVGNAWRNVLVAQARQSNQVANSFLTLQQQIGLIRYHGITDYWQHHRPAILQTATAGGPSSSSSASNSSASNIAVEPNNNNVNSNNNNNSNNNVAKVAFMITAVMRKELADLGYTADQIKALTPVGASLVLHHKLPPQEQKAKLPSLLKAHEQEKAKQAELEEQKRLEQETLEKEKALAAAQKAKEEEPIQDQVMASDILVPMDHQEPNTKVLLQSEPVEGLKLEAPPKSTTTVAAAAAETQSSKGGSSQETHLDTSGPVGSFVQSMEERAKDTVQEWFAVIENRTADNSSVGVALYDTEEEAMEVATLKSGFAERRAKDDSHNLENVPEMTYSIEKTLK